MKSRERFVAWSIVYALLYLLICLVGLAYTSSEATGLRALCLAACMAVPIAHWSHLYASMRSYAAAKGVRIHLGQFALFWLLLAPLAALLWIWPGAMWDARVGPLIPVVAVLGYPLQAGWFILTYVGRGAEKV